MPVKVILAKPFNSKAMQKELEKGVRSFQKRLKTDFIATTDTWDKKPSFVMHNLKVSEAEISGEVGTTDKIYRFVSEGTEPHIIRAKTAKGLVFLPGYAAKTSPGSLVSRPGGKIASGKPVHAQEVHHPGNEAREFPKRIAELRDRDFERTMQEAMDRGATASGHGG